MRVSIEDQPVFLLHSRKYSETSAILDCLSKDYGRFSVLAKGILRQSKKKTQSSPRLFQAYQLTAILKNELGTLISLDTDYLWQQPLGTKWFIANYMNELLIKLVPKHEIFSEVYEHYVQALHILASNDDHTYRLIQFERTLLDSLGYGVDMQYEVRSRDAIEDEAMYLFDARMGFSLCGDTQEQALSGRMIRALHEKDEEYFRDDANALLQAKRIVRMALKYQLGDLQLKSVAVLREVEQAKQGSKVL